LKRTPSEARLVQQVLAQMEGQALELASAANMALPEKNAALTMSSQIKFQTGLRLVFLTNFRIGSPAESKKGLKRVQVRFDVDGSFDQLTAFLNDLKNSAPLSVLDKVNFVGSDDSTRASVALSVYFSPHPTQIPALTEPLKSLTAEETKILNSLAALNPPPLVEAEPQTPVTRANPFE